MAKLLAEGMIRDVPDFPKPGILFKDITPALADPAAFEEIIDLLAADVHHQHADVIVGIESRGFIFGTPVAIARQIGFVPARKVGKLPHDRVTEAYDLEYGSNIIEMHLDAIQPGQNVYIVDDLLATGGTAAATARLVERLGGTVCGFGFLIELDFLDGRKLLEGYPVKALIHY